LWPLLLTWLLTWEPRFPFWTPVRHDREQSNRARLCAAPIVSRFVSIPLEINKTAANYITAHGRRMPEIAVSASGDRPDRTGPPVLLPGLIRMIALLTGDDDLDR